MAKYLYEVTLSGGKSNRDYFKFLENVQNLGAKPPDYGGINNVCIISHHIDAKTLFLLCTDGFKGDEGEVTVDEITSATLLSTDSGHRLYSELVRNYFLPYNKYPNIRL
jgi:hypothetical protein